MMKSSHTFLLGWVLFGLIFTPVSKYAAKDYFAERFDVNLVARPDGSILVTETVVFHFIGGPFTYVFRELPTKETDGISDITALMDDTIFTMGEGAGQFEVKGRNPLRMTWHFPPVSDSTHRFILNYRVQGVTRVDEKYDFLQWNAVPEKHEYLIQASTVQITYPKRSKLVNSATDSPKNVKVETGDSRVIYRVKGLKEDQGMLVSLRFTRNSLISEPPAWQKHQVARTQALYRILPWALAVFALLLIGGIGLLFFVWERNVSIDRGEESTPVIGVRPTTPPGDLPPAFAGVLIANGARPSWSNALATLLDLACRGVLSIEECREKKWFRQQDFEIHLRERPGDLRRHEDGLLDALFTTKQGSLTSIKISDLHTMLPSRFQVFSSPLKREMEQAGLLSKARLAKGHRLMITGIWVLIAGLVVFILSLVVGGISLESENWTPFTVAAIGLGIASSAILISSSVIVMASLYSPLTEAGLHAAVNWRAYSEYLKDVTRERETASRPNLFEVALPYAASFGLAESWSRFFQKQGESKIPAWFQSLSSPGDGDSMGAFVAMLAASSAAGSNSVAGGGAGGAGGGSSGAG